MIHRCPICKLQPIPTYTKTFRSAANAAGCRTWVTGASEKYVVSDPIFDEEEIEKADRDRKTIILDLNETVTASAETPNQKEKPRLALAIATALGVGYAPKAPGTFGSLVGVVTIFLSAVFFLRPAHWSDLFSLHRLRIPR